jgi:hypothetical protein
VRAPGLGGARSLPLSSLLGAAAHRGVQRRTYHHLICTYANAVARAAEAQTTTLAVIGLLA